MELENIHNHSDGADASDIHLEEKTLLDTFNSKSIQRAKSTTSLHSVYEHDGFEQFPSDILLIIFEMVLKNQNPNHFTNLAMVSHNWNRVFSYVAEKMHYHKIAGRTRDLSSHYSFMREIYHGRTNKNISGKNKKKHHTIQMDSIGITSSNYHQLRSSPFRDVEKLSSEELVFWSQAMKSTFTKMRVKLDDMRLIENEYLDKKTQDKDNGEAEKLKLNILIQEIIEIFRMINEILSTLEYRGYWLRKNASINFNLRRYISKESSDFFNEFYVLYSIIVHGRSPLEDGTRSLYRELYNQCNMTEPLLIEETVDDRIDYHMEYEPPEPSILLPPPYYRRASRRRIIISFLIMIMLALTFLILVKVLF